MIIPVDVNGCYTRMRIQTAGSSETFATIYQATRRHILHQAFTLFSGN
jgi:hypothetical protein